MEDAEIRGILNEANTTLSNLSQGLKKLVHHPNCKQNPSECPRFHEICENRLGLDTAILWELSKELNVLRSYVKDVMRFGTIHKTNIRRLVENFKQTYFIAVYAIDVVKLGSIEQLIPTSYLDIIKNTMTEVWDSVRRMENAANL